MTRPSLLASILSLAFLAGPLTAQLPADLDAVPRDALAFIHLRAADLYRSDLAQELRLYVDKAGPQAWQTFVSKCPLDPATLERITLVLLTPQTLANPFPGADPEAMSVLVLVATSQPFERVPLIQTLGPREKVYRDHLYYFNEELWSGLAIVDERSFLIGSEEALIRYFDLVRHQDRNGPLAAAAAVAAGKHPLVVGLNPRLLGKSNDTRLLPPPLQQLLEAHAATFTLDLDQGFRLDARFDFSDAAAAGAGAKSMRDLLQLARLGLTVPIGFLEEKLRTPGKASVSELPQHVASLVGLGALREVDTLLKEAPVQQQDRTMRLALEYKSQTVTPIVAALGSVSFLGARASATFTSVGSTIGGAQKDPVAEHLRVLAAALEKYRAQHGSYPPPALYDEGGRPLLSWRVALLPYLGEEALYRSFKLDEPWDSLHNKRLLKRLPKALQVGSMGARRWQTATQVFTGANTLFEGAKGVQPVSLTRQPILLAHLPGEHAVYWTKPADIVYAADEPLPKLFGRFPARVKVLLRDGSIRDIDQSLDEKALRALIERSDERPAPVSSAAADPLETVWRGLTRHDDAGTSSAWEGMVTLSKTPERTVAFIRERIKPVPAPDVKRVEHCLANVDSPSFQVRTQAVKDLEAFGDAALPAIDRKLVDKSLSLEARRRLEALARSAKTVLSGDELRALRAVEVLEQIGNPEARSVLENLSRGAEGAVLTAQARKALGRLSRKS